MKLISLMVRCWLSKQYLMALRGKEASCFLRSCFLILRSDQYDVFFFEVFRSRKCFLKIRATREVTPTPTTYTKSKRTVFTTVVIFSPNCFIPFPTDFKNCFVVIVQTFE